MWTFSCNTMRSNDMSIIFVVVLRMSTALGYEFDECAARVEFGSAVDM
jgi:hypothetical protein